MYLFLILPSIADIATVKPNGANTFLAFLRNLVFCLVVNNNSCESSSLLKFLIPNHALNLT